jgi:hypothetical protein
VQPIHRPLHQLQHQPAILDSSSSSQSSGYGSAVAPLQGKKMGQRFNVEILFFESQNVEKQFS